MAYQLDALLHTIRNSSYRLRKYYDERVYLAILKLVVLSPTPHSPITSDLPSTRKCQSDNVTTNFSI